MKQENDAELDINKYLMNLPQQRCVGADFIII